MSTRRQRRRRAHRHLKRMPRGSLPWWIIGAMVIIVVLVAASRILR